MTSWSGPWNPTIFRHGNGITSRARKSEIGASLDGAGVLIFLTTGELELFPGSALSAPVAVCRMRCDDRRSPRDRLTLLRRVCTVGSVGQPHRLYVFVSQGKKARSEAWVRQGDYPLPFYGESLRLRGRVCQQSVAWCDLAISPVHTDMQSHRHSFTQISSCPTSHRCGNTIRKRQDSVPGRFSRVCAPWSRHPIRPDHGRAALRILRAMDQWTVSW